MITRFILILIYTVINVLFIDKYSARIVEWHNAISIIYTLLSIAALFALPLIVQKLKRPLVWLIGLGTGFLVAASILQYLIDPMTIQVDRWSAIHNFLEGMLSGTYPYGQQTHLGGYGSPFPVWQILHLPFYAIGNVGASIILAIGLYIYTCYKTRGTQVALWVTILLIASPACWYEVAVRSDLLTNMLIVAVIIEWLVYHRIRLAEHTLAIGILAGLLLSTRLVAAIPLAVLYGYAFIKMDWKKQCAMLLTTGVTFALTWIPFIFWKGSTLLFFEYNPFVLQTRQGSVTSLLIFACIAIYCTIRMRGKEDFRPLLTGGLLTSLVVIAYIDRMYSDNLWTELYSSTFDITYLTMGLPFYLMAIALQPSSRPQTPVETICE